jgi:hypothetical protein
MNLGKVTAFWLMPLLLAALPASSHFGLNSYGFGNGGTATSNSADYGVNALTGEVAGASTSTDYAVGSGEKNVKQADVPTVTLVNSTRWYNQLLLTIGTQNNPSDALYAVEISTDAFANPAYTTYVQSNLTLGSTFGIGNFMSYSAWGGSSGVLLRGLTPGTVYSAKAAAYHGNYTQSAWGPASSSATTYAALLSFEIDVAPTNMYNTTPPYVVNFGTVPVSTVTTATNQVWISFDTNANSGGFVYINGQNGGLLSATTSHTILAQSVDLSTVSEGFGIQGASATQASGGPLAISSPFNTSGTAVGAYTTTLQPIFSSANPITSGRGSFYLMVKTAPLTPSAPDYSEVLTCIAAAEF